MPSITDTTAKAFFAFIVLCAIIAGFFMDKIAPEVFMSVASAVVTYYFGEAQNKKLQQKLDQKEVELQSLKTPVVINEEDLMRKFGITGTIPVNNG